MLARQHFDGTEMVYENLGACLEILFVGCCPPVVLITRFVEL
jgi:hypothetical protein